MADPRKFELDDLLVRPGTYFNPQTEVLVVVDDSQEMDTEIFNMEEFEGGIPPVGSERGEDTDRDGEADDGQAGQRPEPVDVLGQQLDRHEGEHDGDGLVEVAKAPYQALDEHEQGP